MDILTIGIIGVVIVAALILVGLYFSYYNRIRQYENQIDEAWSQIDVQLKRRYDLIPNLVETAKAYMAHERQTLEAVILARNICRKIEGEMQYPGQIRVVVVRETRCVEYAK